MGNKIDKVINEKDAVGTSKEYQEEPEVKINYTEVWNEINTAENLGVDMTEIKKMLPKIKAKKNI